MGYKSVMVKALALSTCLFGAGELLAADPVNPLLQLVNESIIPKHRGIVTFLDTDKVPYQFVAQGREIEGTNVDLSALAKEGISIDRAAGSSGEIFAMATAPATYLKKVTLAHDFYGNTGFDNVPQQLMATVYFARATSRNNGDNDYATYLSIGLRDKDKFLGEYKLNLPAPVYFYKFNGDTSWVESPPMDMSVACDLATFDYNGDGYSDYVLSYIHNPNGTNVKKDCKDEVTKTLVAVIDGKDIYDRIVNKKTVTVKSSYTMMDTFSDKGNYGGGLGVREPGNNYRMVLGDFDGDGVKEVAYYFSKVNKGSGNPNTARVMKVGWDGSKFTFSSIFSKDIGKRYDQSHTIGLAAGDIDNDGRDELVFLYIDTDDEVSIAIYQMDSNGQNLVGKMNEEPGVNVGHKNNTREQLPTIEAAIADLDGDGFGELVWLTSKPKENHPLLAVHKWEGGVLAGLGSFATYDLNGYGLGWATSNSNTMFAMKTGMFNYFEDDATFVKPPQQIAIVHRGNNSSSDSNAANLDWGFFSWNQVDKLKVLGKGIYTGKMRGSRASVRIDAADLYNDSMVLGPGTAITLDDNVELMVSIQAPPKHWDVISGSVMVNGSPKTDENGNALIDVFSQLNGYSTVADSSSSLAIMESTTKTSNIDFGASVGFSAGRVSPTKAIPPFISASANYANNRSQQNTSSSTKTMKYNTKANADKDDQLYYRVNSYTIWRYPVIFPEDMSTTVVSDDNGNDVEAQTYVQVVVPEVIASDVFPAPGRNISWYEPLHDGLNLFTYPREVANTIGFPVGAEKKDENDPWIKLNGVLLTESDKQWFGNPDAVSATAQISEATSEKEMGSTKHSVGADLGVNIMWGVVIGKSIPININADRSWQTAVTTETNAQDNKGATINWPGAANYASPSGVPSRHQQFLGGVGIYTQDDGAFVTAYAVNTLSNGLSDLWGADSPYKKAADPGLVLPFRWEYNGSANTSFNKYMIRSGLVLKEKSSSETSNVSFTKDNVPGKAVPTNSDVDLVLRVVNYSFVQTSEPITVTYSFQPITNINQRPDVSLATVSFSETITMPLFGREQWSDVDNWIYHTTKWVTPKKAGLGYLHVKLDYPGAQLNVDNDYGFVLVGIYDKEDAESLKAQSIESAMLKANSLEDASNAVLPMDLKVSNVRVCEIDENGNILEEFQDLVNIPSSARLRVFYTISAENVGSGDYKILPKVQVFLMGVNRARGQKPTDLTMEDIRGLFASDVLPVIEVGQEYDTYLDYVPRDDTNVDFNTLCVVARSPFLPVAKDSSSKNNIGVIAFDDFSDLNRSSSGCDSFSGDLLLLIPLFGGMVYMGRKRK